MQGQGSSVKSFPESFQFDRGSDSNSSDMEQSFYRGNRFLNSNENPTLADILLSRNDGSMDCLNMVPPVTDCLSIWNSHDLDSTAYIASQENGDEDKMDVGWSPALSIYSGGGPNLEERHCERSSVMSPENVDLNLNNTPVDVGQAFTQRFSAGHTSHNQEYNMYAGAHSNITEASLCPFLPEFFEPEHVPYSASNGSFSSGVVEQSLENSGRVRSAIDGRRVACKRKNVEGVIGESSSSHNISADLSMPNSSRHLPSATSLDESLTPSFSPLNRGVSSGWHPFSSMSGNVENSQRNLRMRLNLLHQCDVSSPQSHSALSSNRLPTIWLPGEPFSSTPFIHSTEQSRHHVQPFPGFDDHACQYPSSSMFGSSSSSAFSHHRIIASPEETSIGSLPRNEVADHRTFSTRSTADGLVQDSPNWNPSNSRASSSSGVIALPGSNRTSSAMIPLQLPTYLSDPGQSPRAARRGHSPLHLRTATPLDRLRDGISSLPSSARSREGRSRMISEIRNALDLMRRGGNLQFEDVFIFDRYGRADLYDRHRDMRLDVDNMSYEELLALEERIGNVSTGLDEDTILKCVKRRKYSSCNLEVASSVEEPCCICREEYGEGEDVGTLNCKHDFHAPCIKKWLMIKNLCPICKTTAVVT